MAEGNISRERKNELLNKLGSLRRDISSLKASLNNLNNQKESFYEKKNELSKKIVGNIRQIRELKGKRDSLTKLVKEDKSKREEDEKKIDSKISELKELKKKVSEIRKKHNITEDPSRIKDQIEKLEENMETEVISFSKEKGIMKTLKDLKKKYKGAEVVADSWKKLDEVSAELDTLKRERNEIRKKIKNRAGESQKYHEEMIKLSNDIDPLKEEELKMMVKFGEFKTKFTETNNQLKEKINELRKLSEELEKYNIEVAELKKKEENKQLEERSREVEEKLRKGGKLTTEDLLVIQSLDK